MMAKMYKLRGIKDVDFSPNDRTALALTWKYFLWGALAGIILAVVWNHSLTFWTLLGGAVFGVIIVAVFLVAVACDLVRFPGGESDKDDP